MNIILISTIYNTLLFFISGFDKITNFIQVVKEFTNRTKLPFTLSKIIIIGVIMIVFTKKNGEEKKWK